MSLSKYSLHSFTCNAYLLGYWVEEQLKSYTMNIFCLFPKQLFTAILSTLDIGSDLVNSLDFIGFNASETITSYVEDQIEGNGNNTNWKWEMGIDKINDLIRIESGINGTLNNYPIDENVLMLWGLIGIGTMFLPGIVAFLLSCRHDGYVALSYLLFPVAIIVFQFYTIFTLKGGKHQPYIAIGIALEAFFESFFQLVLQIYTILYGYTITGKQIVAMCFSFFILSKASIDLDTEMLDRSANVMKTIRMYLQLVPGYAANICFRSMTFAITFAFLKIWALFPITLLFIELCIVCCICFCGTKRSNVGFSAYLPLIMTNLGVTNIGLIGASKYVKQKMKEDDQDIDGYKQQSDWFVRLSAIISFMHHMVVLSFILYCIMNDEVFNNLVIGRFGLQHWNDKKFILNKFLDLRKHQLVYYIFAAITGLGSLGLSATLYFGARSLK